MKMLTTLFVILLISIRSSSQTSLHIPSVSPDFSNAHFGDCGPLIPRDPKISIFPRSPYAPREPLPIAMLDTGTKFRYADTETIYSVSFGFQDPKPPSCQAIARRLKNHAARISEFADLSQKLSAGKQLSYKEVRSFLETSRRYVPEILNVIDQTVEMNLKWKFLYPKSDIESIFYFLKDTPDDFRNYIIKGPGLLWTQTTDGIPPFFDIVFDRDVTVTYEMQMMDFCFGDNHISIRGKFAEGFGPKDPILMATWERNIRKVNQIGSWTIRTAAELADNESPPSK